MIIEQYLVAFLVFIAVIAASAGILLLRGIRLPSLRDRLGRPTGWDEAGLPPAQPLLQRVASRLGQVMSQGGTSQNLKVQLAQAGYTGERAPGVFLGAKILLLAAGLGLFGTLMYPVNWPLANKVIIVLAAGGLCAFLPNLLVRLRRSSRQANIRRHLPDAIDLLEICVSGGMGLEMAWNVVTDEIAQVSMLLSDEMAFTNLEINLGASRSVAMRHMSDRTGCQEIASLAAALTQSEQFGTSIGEMLRVFAGTMREERSQRASEAAEKMAVKLLFPLVFLLFPAMIIVVVGPAAIEWIKLLGDNR